VLAVLIATGLLAVSLFVGARRLRRATGSVSACRPDRWRVPAHDLSAAAEAVGRALDDRGGR
jgi:hypothetical protein